MRDNLPFPIIEIEEKFYQLDLSETLDDKNRTIREIAELIPWQYSIIEIVDSFKNASLRISSRQFALAIQIQRTNFRLKRLAKRGNGTNYDDLEEASFLLSGMGDIFSSYSDFKKELDRLAFRLKELFELNKEILSDDVKVHLLSRVLFQESGFIGNQDSYGDPNNSYLTRVIQSKKGIPISLSVVYLLVANRLRLPVYGTNIPLHFILQYESENFTTFIDPFHGGILLEKSTCEKFLRANGYEDVSKFFDKTGTLSILKRMYRNLIHIYRKNGQREMERVLTKQLQILENKEGNAFTV
ncbi:MAG: transglutaminase-like domain-containing protein [Leptospiraceae bacterium]|nr:transglutaminase [Leptospiraceae bacterium]MCK6381120.1 transglutaminase-like domain-containing protein [Leptospiraceae bacterium]